MNALPLIVVEVVLVFGGALAFGWWQLRDLRRERERRENRAPRQSRETTGADDTGVRDEGRDAA